MKKTIGIIAREYIADYKEIELYGCKRELIQYLTRYDVNVITIPILFENDGEWERVKDTLDFCDGIIAPGGSKIHEIDYKIIKYLHEIDKPTLGICLGMQTIGKLFNGKIRTEIESGNHCSEEEYVHDIIIKRESLLYQIIGEERIKVNSRHMRQIPFTNLDCVAYSEDNILEAVEDKNKKFFLGIQWHPESRFVDIYRKRLFYYFFLKL